MQSVLFTNQGNIIAYYRYIGHNSITGILDFTVLQTYWALQNITDIGYYSITGRLGIIAYYRHIGYNSILQNITLNLSMIKRSDKIYHKNASVNLLGMFTLLPIKLLGTQ